MSALQVISITFSILMIFYSYVYYRRRYFGILGFIGWSIVFILLITITAIPENFAFFKDIFKVARLFDLVVVIGMFFLVVLTFLNFIHLQKIKNKLERLVQHDALKNKHQKNQDDEGSIS